MKTDQEKVRQIVISACTFFINTPILWEHILIT